jgi:hypothetical protein
MNSRTRQPDPVPTPPAYVGWLSVAAGVLVVGLALAEWLREHL